MCRLEQGAPSYTTQAKAEQPGRHASPLSFHARQRSSLRRRGGGEVAGAVVLAAPEVVHGEVELGGGEEEVHGLRGAEQRHHLAHRLEKIEGPKEWRRGRD